MRRALGLLCFGLVSSPGLLSADPGLWARARAANAGVSAAEARSRARSRLRAEQLFWAASEPAREKRGSPQSWQESATAIELGAGAHTDPWQAALLGRALAEASPTRAAEARALLVGALPRLAESDFAGEGWFDLGVSALRALELPLAERAFSRALELSWDEDDRATIHRNRGKTRFLRGDLLTAMADFRQAVELARGPAVTSLSHFALGVALERAGDTVEGLREVARGAAIRLPVPPYETASALDLPSFVPDYDVHYYRALAEMAAAEAAADDAAARAHYAAALASWDSYLPIAEANADHFAAGAARKRQRCAAALARLDGEPPSAVPRAASGRVR